MPWVLDLIARAFRLYAKHPVRFITISAPSLLITAPVAFVSTAWFGWLLQQASVIAGEVVISALVWAAATTAAGERPGFLQCYRRVFDRLWSILGVAVAYFFAPILLALTIVGIPWALRLLVRWFFATQCVIIGDLDAGDALHESSRIVTGKTWQVAGAIVVVGLPSGLAFTAFLILTWPDGLDPMWAAAWSALAVLLAPAYVCFHTLLFLQLRERAEVEAAA